MKCTGLYSSNLYTWRRVSSTSASAFFRLRSLLACTRLPPALASRLESPFAWTHLTPGLASRLDSPPTWTHLTPALASHLRSPSDTGAWICVQPIIFAHENASRRKSKAQQSVMRHFSAHSSTSCMRHPRPRSSTHSEASLRRRHPLKHRISAHKLA